MPPLKSCSTYGTVTTHTMEEPAFFLFLLLRKGLEDIKGYLYCWSKSSYVKLKKNYVNQYFIIIYLFYNYFEKGQTFHVWKFLMKINT